jgi:hypothetical protein
MWVIEYAAQYARSRPSFISATACTASSDRLFALALDRAAKFETSREAYEFLTGFVLQTGMPADYARVVEV